MYTAIVKLDTLTNAVGTATQDHDLVTPGRIGLALFLIGRVHISRIGRKLGRTGIHPLVDRENIQLVALTTQTLLTDGQQLGQTGIRKALALEAVHQAVVDISQAQRLDLLFFVDQIFDLHQEPGINFGELENLLHAHTGTEGISQIPDAVSARNSEFASQIGLRIGCGQINLGVETAGTHFQATQRFLHGLLERTTNRHHLTHRLHLRRQASISVGELFKGKTWNLGNNIVDCRLKGRRRAATSNIVLQLIQGVTHSELGGDLGNRKARRFGSQCRGARYPGVHFDHDHTAGIRTDTKLNVGTTGFHTNLTQYRQGGVTHDLVFLIGQRLGWRDSNGVTGVHTHRIEVLDRADDNAVVLFIADHFHLVLFPANQRLINQQLIGGRKIETASTDLFKLFAVVSNTATRAAHGERGTNNARKADLIQHTVGLSHAVGDTGTRAIQADGLHRLVKARTVFSLVDSVGIGTDHFDVEFFQYAVLFQVQGTVQCRLPTHRRQQRIRTFFFDDLGNRLPLDRLNVGRVSHRRIGHDRRRVGVNQNHPETLFLQRFTSLRAGVIKFTGLTDHDWASAEDQNAFDISTFWHSLFNKSLGVPGLRRACSWHR